MLPSQTPNSLMVNKLNNFLLDCAINPQMKETYSNTRNVFSWSESTGVFFFIKFMNKKNKLRILLILPIIYSKLAIFNH
jgi:hypothetical protein